jgi:hypothetical protein
VVGLAAVAVVLLLLGSLLALGLGPFARSSTSPPQTGTAGAFTQGEAVTLHYSGGLLCDPSLAQLFPSVAALNATTPCEVGGAYQSAIRNQIPQWWLVPAFDGLSTFGDANAGATVQGFPTASGSTLLTDCPAGGSPQACPQTPSDLYSPEFGTLETFANLSEGVAGLPAGLLPTPAHDVLINTSASFPASVVWGTIVVLVFDPNIFPVRGTGACAVSVPSNLTLPTGNCLTSLAALDRALDTASTAVNGTNGGSPGNPVWKALGGPAEQVVVRDDLTVPQLNSALNSNLYQNFGVSPTLPTFAGT